MLVPFWPDACRITDLSVDSATLESAPGHFTQTSIFLDAAMATYVLLEQSSLQGQQVGFTTETLPLDDF